MPADGEMAHCIVLGCGACRDGLKRHIMPSDSLRLQQKVFLLDGVVEQAPPEHASLLSFCQACYLRARNAVVGNGAGSWIHEGEGLDEDAAIKLARVEYLLGSALARLPRPTITTTLDALHRLLQRRAKDAPNCDVLRAAIIALEAARNCDGDGELADALNAFLASWKHSRARKVWACRPELSRVLVALDEERGVALGAAMTTLYLSRLGSAQTSAPSSSRASPGSASPASSRSGSRLSSRHTSPAPSRPPSRNSSRAASLATSRAASPTMARAPSPASSGAAPSPHRPPPIVIDHAGAASDAAGDAAGPESLAVRIPGDDNYNYDDDIDMPDMPPPMSGAPASGGMHDTYLLSPSPHSGGGSLPGTPGLASAEEADAGGTRPDTPRARPGTPSVALPPEDLLLPPTASAAAALAAPLRRRALHHHHHCHRHRRHRPRRRRCRHPR